MDKTTVILPEKENEKKEATNLALAEASKKEEKALTEKKQSIDHTFVITKKEQPIIQKSDEILYNDAYVSSFESLTISDIKKQKEEIELQQFKQEKEKLIENEFDLDVKVEKNVAEEVEEITETEVAVKKLIIEKPNYDLIAKNDKKVSKKKKFGLKKIAFACCLALASIGCVGGCVMIDNLSSSYIAVQDAYNVNLISYLKNINNLNATNKSLELFETYPDQLEEPSSIGKSSNWFDNLTNFIAGLFGG